MPEDEEGFVFGSFRLIPNQRMLSEDGKAVRVGGRALDILAVLRKALADGRAGKRYIANHPGRGYAFVAPVTRENALSATPAATGTDEAGNLPALLTRVVSRDGVISRLAQQLPRHRFVTIAGPGGIGKTTVAVAVADALRASCSDGVWYVELASLSDPDLVPSAVGAALGSRFQAATTCGRSSPGCATETRYSCSTPASTSSSKPRLSPKRS